MKALGSLLIGCLGLSGCAVMTLDQAMPLARNSPDWELCYVAVSGRGQQALRQAVYQVMRERSTDCSQHAALVSAKLGQDAASSAAQTQLGLQLLQAGRNRPTPAPAAPVTCRSFDRGTYIQTVCN